MLLISEDFHEYLKRSPYALNYLSFLEKQEFQDDIFELLDSLLGYKQISIVEKEYQERWNPREFKKLKSFLNSIDHYNFLTNIKNIEDMHPFFKIFKLNLNIFDPAGNKKF